MHPALGARLSYVTAAAVIVVALWASGSPALVYPVYEDEWQLAPVVTTEIFAVYPVVLVIVLTLFGGISDHIGRRAALLAGMVSIVIGVAIFAMAGDVVWLFVGRVFQGIGVGLALSPAGAALVEYGGDARRASLTNTVAIAVGLSLATVVGGALVQYAPLPSELTFWVLLIAVALVTVAVFFLPRTPPADAVGRWRPRPVKVPRALRGVVVAATLAITSTYAVGAVLISLGGQIVQDVLHTDNALVAGAVLAIGSVGSGVVSFVFGRRIAPGTAVWIGGLLGAGAATVIVAAANTASLGLFIGASVGFGVSSGLLFLGSIGLINANAPARHRAGMLSMVYLVAYVGQGVVSVGLGALATSLSLRVGLNIVGPALIALALVTAIVGLVAGRALTAAVSRPRLPDIESPSSGTDEPDIAPAAEPVPAATGAVRTVCPD